MLACSCAGHIEQPPFGFVNIIELCLIGRITYALVERRLKHSDRAVRSREAAALLNTRSELYNVGYPIADIRHGRLTSG